jgi:hypothetical protein
MSSEEPAGVATSTANRPLNQALNLESVGQSQSRMASSRIPAGDDKPDEQTTTIPNDSLSNSPPLKFADQSHSRLMTIPQELRNMIYGYVYENITDTQKTATKSKGEELDHEAEVCCPPTGISIAEIASPTKDAILPCRELYMEMKKMQKSAYRAYWTENQFDFEFSPMMDFSPMIADGWFDDPPSDEDLEHIHHFSSSMGRRHMFDLIFELGRWRARVFPFVGKSLEPEDFNHNDWNDDMFMNWRWVQEKVEDLVKCVLSVSTGHEGDAVFDPGLGQGWRYDDLEALLDSEVSETLEYWENYSK